MRFAIAGASGRMGRMLIEAVLASPGDTLVGALDVPGSPALGSDASAFLGRDSGVAITADLHTALAQADVLIDFTRPAGTLAHLAACRQHGVRMVIGTTGFDDAGKAAIAEAAKTLPIVFAANMSVGVNVTIKLLEMAARALADGYDIEIIEAHHRHKVDAPSGTALAMGEAIAQAQGRQLKDCAVYRPRRPHRRAPAPAASVLPPSAAATSSATTPCCSPAPVSASRSRTRPATAWATPRAACAPHISWPINRPACTAWPMC